MEINLTLVEFGRYHRHNQCLLAELPVVAPNGWGKTTLINAYIFALTGQTLNGFAPRNVDADATCNTEVILDGLFERPIRRTLSPDGGTKLYFGEDVITQKDFEGLVNVKLLSAFANTNLLCESSLTSEQLRKLLCVTDVMAGDERATLEKRLKATRDLLKQAEARAVSVVSVPPTTCEPLTQAERMFCDEFNKHASVPEPVTKCRACGASFSAKRVAEATEAYETAQTFIKANAEYYDELCRKHAEYLGEQQRIADAKRIVELCTQARKDAITYKTQLEAIEAELREYDASAVRASLPDGVQLITESQTKSGTSKSVCTLTYNGIPLKSVNRAQRVKICLDLLTDARSRAGLDDYPIWVDNAESVRGLDKYKNLIAFYVEV